MKRQDRAKITRANVDLFNENLQIGKVYLDQNKFQESSERIKVAFNALNYIYNKEDRRKIILLIEDFCKNNLEKAQELLGDLDFEDIEKRINYGRKIITYMFSSYQRRHLASFCEKKIIEIYVNIIDLFKNKGIDLQIKGQKVEAKNEYKNCLWWVTKISDEATRKTALRYKSCKYLDPSTVLPNSSIVL